MKIVTSISQITQAEQMSWLGLPYAIDIESTGLDYMNDELIGVALHVANESYYFVRKHTADDGITIVDYLDNADLRIILTPLMTQQNVTGCLHNSKFDLHFFARYDLPFFSHNFDTLAAAQLLNENRKNGLKELAALVDEEHGKYHLDVAWTNFPKGCPLNVPLQPFAEYAARDVIVTYKLWRMFREQLPKDTWRNTSLQEVFTHLWMPLIPVLQEMEAAGFRIDTEKAQVLHDSYIKVMDEKRKIVERAGYEMLSRKPVEEIAGLYWKIVREDDEEHVYTNDEGWKCIDVDGIELKLMKPTPRSEWRRPVFNVGSNDQLVDLILGDVSLPEEIVPLTLTKGGDDSVNVENLKIIKYYLGEKTPHYIDALMEWRKAEKFVGTYLKTFLTKCDDNQRIHCFFSMAQNDLGKGGTRTGRLSSSGPNLQNIPSRGEIGDEARSLFVASEGNVLIVADYSNMETVLFAHYSKDPVLMKAFSENLDVHALTACGQHGLDYQTFVDEYKNGNPQYDKMRRTAKTLLFGQAYGMGVVKLRRALLVENGQEYTWQECKAMLDAFNETYAGVAEWKKGVIRKTGELGFVVTLLGRKRRLPLVFSQDRELRSRAQRQGVNAIIQGTCADIMFQAMVPIQGAFKAMGGTLIASVHDELIAEVPAQYATAAKATMQSLMVDLINPRLDCKLKAEAHSGISWLDAKKG